MTSTSTSTSATQTTKPVSAASFIKGLKKVADVTRPLLKIKTGTEYAVLFQGPMHLGKEIEQKKTIDEKTGEIIDAPKRQPAHIANVENLVTREEVTIICSTVFRKEIDAAYPNDSYVGKAFVFSITKIDGKNYNLVSVHEVADPYESERSAPALEEADHTALNRKK